MADYNASKFAAVGLDEAVRLELQSKGHSGYIKTTCICPYFINTGMFDGAKTSFPFSLLDQDRVVDRIVAAIRQEEHFVVLPWRGNMLFLTRLLPTTIADRIGKMIGAHNAMSDFTGRGSMEKRIPGLTGHSVK